MANIAIIDDDLDLIGVFRTLVQPFHEVRTYTDAASALAGVKVDKPDVVLLDISLGEANGVDVLHQLRAFAGLESVPVIAVTAHSGRAERAKFLAEGFTDFIAKPLTDHGVVIAVIETALAGESAPELDDDLDAETGAGPMGLINAATAALAALELGEVERAKILLKVALRATAAPRGTR